ncbi:hypothetical protein CW714_07240 [Methanophagales archaeon]|nr:MAG: hypothetical protein CW714_07240 [Methanophagales archaeon]
MKGRHRGAKLCTNPTNETAVLVDHGTYNEAYFQGWVNDSKSFAEKVKLILRHSKGIEIEDVLRICKPYATPPTS